MYFSSSKKKKKKKREVDLCYLLTPLTSYLLYGDNCSSHEERIQKDKKEKEEEKEKQNKTKQNKNQESDGSWMNE
jgi:hypothetical protein